MIGYFVSSQHVYMTVVIVFLSRHLPTVEASYGLLQQL